MKNLLIAIALLSVVGCNKLNHHSSSGTPEEPAVVVSVSGSIVRPYQVLDIHQLDLSKPFVVLINGVVIDRYEYTFYEGNTFVTLKNKVTHNGNLVTITTISVANEGDSWEVQTL